MSGIMLAFFVSSGGISIASDGAFSGAPLADVSFGG